MGQSPRTLTATAIQNALAIFSVDTSRGIQITPAAHLLDCLQPPLQTNRPTLIGAIGPRGAELAHHLLQCYPAATSIHALAADDSARQSFTLAELAQTACRWDWWHIPPRSEDSDLTHLVDLIAQLRAPNGCPWDRAQTHTSLRPYLLEEAHELLEALDAADSDSIRDELGDVLLQILLHCQLAAERGAFTIHDVLEQLARKLVRRHPHVWGGRQLGSPEAVRQSWEQLKREERGEAETSRALLDGLPKTLPALLQAQRLQERAARVGFDWENEEDVAAKVREELAELLQASPGTEREAELGDVLFSLVNWARWLRLPDIESTLRAANQRFRRRFSYVETRLQEKGIELGEASLSEMDALWEEAKLLGC
ncbi:MAG: nucleoside triphosphate pyrophosphohydrolase [Anaerolineaceae bacterium]|nr:nucleoside triphosphate pyrophosphohydrolase [Anaerolineaceae bacterium]